LSRFTNEHHYNSIFFLIESIITCVLVCVTESPHYANLPSRGHLACACYNLLYVQTRCNVNTEVTMTATTYKQP